MMKNHSDKSANYPCLNCADKKVIYLTFDDGPEPGTYAIYEKLNAMKVPATFFFVGENVIASETGALDIVYGKCLAPGFFKTVFNNSLFQIGNHSQTQSHQFYQSYYDTGLLINSETLAPSADSSKYKERRSVLVDFELASVAFTHALNGTPAQYIKDLKKVLDYGYRGNNVSKLFSGYSMSYSRFLTARMPGTPRWRLPKKKDSAWDWLRDSADRDDEADNLFENDYKIYSWDREWHMKGGSVMSPDVRKEHLDAIKDKNKDGFWDHYYSENKKDNDRPEESVDTLFSQTQSDLNEENQCVILMHDRQFRENPDGSNPYITQLENFIIKCQKKGFEFDVLENY